MKKLLCLILSLSLCPLFGVYPAAEEASSPAQSLKNFGVYSDLNLNGRTDVGDALLQPTLTLTQWSRLPSRFLTFSIRWGCFQSLPPAARPAPA